MTPGVVYAVLAVLAFREFLLFAAKIAGMIAANAKDKRAKAGAE